MKEKTFYANGKLLLTAEYFVLDGAKALAVPTRFGQSLKVVQHNDANLHWHSYDSDRSLWFQGIFDYEQYDILDCNDEKIGQTLSDVLKKAAAHTPPTYLKGFRLETHLTFPREWGLGTSSTLIYTISKLFKTSPYNLLAQTFGGSGYDLACASAQQPIIFQRKDGKLRHRSSPFKPPFADNLYFIYLGKKQNSREGIAHYREKVKTLPPQYFARFSEHTYHFAREKNLDFFERIIHFHEENIAEVLELNTAKSLYFNDFWGAIKSLGAWGGDFVMATSKRSYEETQEYFEDKGFSTIIRYKDMVL